LQLQTRRQLTPTRIETY